MCACLHEFTCMERSKVNLMSSSEVVCLVYSVKASEPGDRQEGQAGWSPSPMAHQVSPSQGWDDRFRPPRLAFHGCWGFKLSSLCHMASILWFLWHFVCLSSEMQNSQSCGAPSVLSCLLSDTKLHLLADAVRRTVAGQLILGDAVFRMSRG